MKVGFIGAGKAGFSLGKYFADGGITVTGYYSLHENSARAAAEFTGSQFFGELSDLLKESGVIFLTVPDGAVSSVYGELCKFDIKGKQICHCSGVMTAAAAFPGISRRGAFGYSIHPLFPISDKTESYRKMAGAFFCIEGSFEHLDEWKSVLEGLGFHVQMIDGKDKPKYHAACAISSNLFCALADESIELLTQCGFTRETALTALSPLIRQNTENILRYGPTNALTGAVERNDIQTVEKHLSCFSTDNERELYRAVSQRLIRIAKEKNPQNDYSELEKLLTGGI